jgi:hypothetical protein
MNKNFKNLLYFLLAQQNSRTYTTSSLHTRGYTLLSQASLHPYFVTGFADAESCFTVKLTKNDQLKTG